MSARLRLLCVALTAAALGVSACGGAAATPASASPSESTTSSAAWNAVLAAAKKEGSVTYYDTHVQAQLDNLAKAFAKAYPDIKLSPVRLIGTDSLPKVEAERASGAEGADVLSLADEVFGKSQLALGANRLKKLVGPDVTKLPPSVLRNGGYWAISSYNILELGWNTDLVKTAPKTYEDLLKPEFKGKIGLAENNNPATVTYYQFLANNGGPDYLTKLAAQKPTIYATAAALAQGLASGEVSVTPYALPSIFEALKAKGAPVQYNAPTGEKVWANSVPVYALGWAKHPNAAQILINFMFTPAGQAAIAAGGVAVITPAPKTALTDVAHVVPGDTTSLTKADVDAAIASWKKTFGR